MKVGYLGTLDGVKKSRKIGYTGVIDGIKKDDNRDQKTNENKSFVLKYDRNDPKLYSPAKITIGDKVIETDKAMWDTGATIVAISHKIAEEFHAKPNSTGTGIMQLEKETLTFITDVFI